MVKEKSGKIHGIFVSECEGTLIRRDFIFQFELQSRHTNYT